MGKTIRRKSQKRNDWYENKGIKRNNPHAADAYFHSDMPNRAGRGATVHKGVKDDANTIRRCELGILKYRVAKQDASEVMAFNNDKLAKNKANECWKWN